MFEHPCRGYMGWPISSDHVWHDGQGYKLEEDRDGEDEGLGVQLAALLGAQLVFYRRSHDPSRHVI